MYAAGYMLILWGCLVVLGAYATVRNKVLGCLVGAWDHVRFWRSGQGFGRIWRS